MPQLNPIRVRRDTAANWTATNPTLNSGEPGLETDTNKLKFGDGATTWNALSYYGGAAATQAQVTAGTSATTFVSPLRLANTKSSVLLTLTPIASLAANTITTIAISANSPLGTASTDMTINASSVTINTAGRYRFSMAGYVNVTTSGAGQAGAFIEIDRNGLSVREALSGSTSYTGVASTTSAYNSISDVDDFAAGDVITFNAAVFSPVFTSSNFTPTGKACLERIA